MQKDYPWKLVFGAFSAGNWSVLFDCAQRNPGIKEEVLALLARIHKNYPIEANVLTNPMLPCMTVSILGSQVACEGLRKLLRYDPEKRSYVDSLLDEGLCRWKVDGEYMYVQGIE